MDDLVNYELVTPNDKYRLDHPLRIQFYREMEEAGDFDLSVVEGRWAEDYDYLLSHGYQLRPRFHPGWTPSWRGTDLVPVACEDHIAHFKESVIDAKRLEDGKIVAIKRTSRYTFEAKIACMLSTSESLNDPMNHCVPILDHFPDTRSPELGSFIVMPLLRAFNDPPFAYVDEVVDFVRQTLEGLAYIHSQNVAHCDLSDGNIMMEGRGLYGKEGFHPSDQDLTAGDVTVFAKPRTRKDVGFVRYYITDFGLSVHFSDSDRPRLVTGNRHQDITVPELSSSIPYDPFPVDVFSLGNVFKRNFLDNYSNVEFLSPLCCEMTRQLPMQRPTARGALELFQRSVSSYRGMSLRWRLRERGETRLRRIIGDFRSAFKELGHQMKIPVAVLFSALRVSIKFPAKVLSALVHYGPHRLVAHLRRRLGNRETQPLLG